MRALLSSAVILLLVAVGAAFAETVDSKKALRILQSGTVLSSEMEPDGSWIVFFIQYDGERYMCAVSKYGEVHRCSTLSVQPH